MKEEYSPYKIIKHTTKLTQLMNHELCNPVNIQMDLTNRCSHNCIFCLYRTTPAIRKTLYTFDREQEISLTAILRFLDSVKNYGVKAIELTGGGEPTLHKDFRQILKYGYERGFQASLVTNGSFKTNLMPLLGDLVWCRFSVDAATAETHQKIHRSKDFDTVCGNLWELVDYKKKNNKSIVIGFSFVLTKENAHEILDACKLAKEIGCDTFRISPYYSLQGAKYHEAHWEIIQKQLTDCKDLEEENFQVFILDKRLGNLTQGRKDYKFCNYQHLVGVVGADGNMYACCVRKYDASACFGNIKRGFNAVWYGVPRIDFIQNMRANMCHVSCWMDDKNRLLEYMLSENPKHVNFM